VNYVVCGQSIFSVQGPPPPRYPITSDNPSCPTRFATAAEFLGQPGRPARSDAGGWWHGHTNTGSRCSRYQQDKMNDAVITNVFFLGQN
jgi:hypothetical protein